MEDPDRFQLHLVLPSRQEAASHPRLRDYLARGFRIVQLQRVTDREVVVTLARAATPMDPVKPA
jgi:hypothetical protein